MYSVSDQAKLNAMFQRLFLSLDPDGIDPTIVGGNFSSFASTLAPSPGLTNIASGLATNYAADFRTVSWKITIPYTVWTANALTQDLVVGVIPAKTQIVGIVADTTAAYTGSTTATLVVGVSAGGGELLAVHDVKTAAVTKGLLDADMGTGLTRAAAIQGGYRPSWTAASNLNVRMTTTVANIGNGTVTNFTGGSTTLYVELQVL